MSLDKEKILAAAQKFEDKEQYDKAIREYLKIAESDRGDDRVLLRLATCYERAKKPDEAARTYVKLSVAYREQGAYQKSLAVLKQAQKYSQDDEIAMSMAELYSALGLPHEAVGQLERCLERCDVKENRRAYMRILQSMVRVDGENVQTRIRYANLLLEDGDQEGARRQYTLGLAQLLSKERFGDYIQTAREYLKFQPKDTDVLRELAQIFVRMERYDEAVMVLSGLNNNERTPEIRECLISCYIRLNRINDAVRELKALAHQYEEEGGREDLIEDVWLRAQKLAPNDPEILSRTGDEPPLLSDSALNVLMPAGGGNVNSNAGNAYNYNEISNSERQCVALFSKTMEAYRQGWFDEAKRLCFQILDCNEQYLPALQLLSQIFENQGDNNSLAQIERKIARVVFDSDADEAVRHVLKAERFTPHAWENVNLLLAFGLNPADYGMSVPNSMAPVSQSRVSAAAVPRGPNTRQVPPVPSAAPIGRPLPPPIPKPGGARPPLPPPRYAQTVAPIQGRPAAPVEGMGRLPAGNNKVINPYAPMAGGHNAGLHITSGQTQETASFAASVSNEELDDVFDSLVGNGQPVEKKPHALDPLTDKTPLPSNVVSTNEEPEHVEVPAWMRRSNAQINPYTAEQFDSEEAARQNIANYNDSIEQLTPVMQKAVPQRVVFRADSDVDTGVIPTPVNMVPVSTSLPVVNQIPESELQRVQETLQEVNFYASLSLLDDARNMLSGLIDEFGDIDIIHEAKVKLDSLG